MKILILGGFGFMGQNLNIAFKNSPYKIANESRRTGCDLTNYDSLLAKIKEIKPDIIINAAAHIGNVSYVSQEAVHVVHDNTMMYLNLYNAVSNVDKLIKIINPIGNCAYPGNAVIYNESGFHDGEVHESVMSYGNAKKMGYIISKCYDKQYHMKTTNLIMSNAYGPYDDTDEGRVHATSGLIIRMIKAQRNGDKEFTIWGTGTPIREWIYMPDMAKLIRKVIDNNMWDLPNPINIGIGKGISINETTAIIKKCLDYDCELVFDKSKPDGAPIKIMGTEIFNQHFKDFKFTDYIDGINNTIEYYKEII